MKLSIWEERRAKRTLEECKAEIEKLQRYAEKSVLAGDEEVPVDFWRRRLRRKRRK